MRKTSKPAFESIEFVFGTTGAWLPPAHLLRWTHHHRQPFVEELGRRRQDGPAQAWNDFAEDHAEELEVWSDQYHGAIRAWTPIDPADRENILEQFIGSPEATSAQDLLDEIGSSSRAFERLSKLATVSNGAPGMAFGTAMTADDAMAGVSARARRRGLRLYPAGARRRLHP